MRNKYAFSLAETLTVLMIIGVISALLVPVLNSSIEKQKTVSALKRLYSSFSINIQTVLNEANCSSISCLRAYGKNKGIVTYDQNDVVVQEDERDEEGNPVKDENGDVAHRDVTEYRQARGHVFANPKYFNIIEICGDYDCTPPAKDDEDAPKKMCNSCIASDVMLPTGIMETQKDNYHVYRLNNGAIMALYNFGDGGTNCGETEKVGLRDSSIGVCGIVVFDVNAAKNPNTPGKDLFAFYILDEAVNDSYLIPIGYKGYKGLTSFIGEGGSCSPNRASEFGYNCTAKIMQDGWEIKY